VQARQHPFPVAVATSGQVSVLEGQAQGVIGSLYSRRDAGHDSDGPPTALEDQTT
jgi:hypothetical protein